MHWLSHAKMIQRVEVRGEIAIFLDENHNEKTNMFRDDNFIAELTYSVEIFGNLSDFS